MLALTFFLEFQFFFSLVIVFFILPCVIDWGRTSGSGDYFLINDVITVACAGEGYREVYTGIVRYTFCQFAHREPVSMAVQYELMHFRAEGDRCGLWWC